MYYTDGSGAISDNSVKTTNWSSQPNYINSKADEEKYKNLDISAFLVPEPQTNNIAYRNKAGDEGGFNA